MVVTGSNEQLRYLPFIKVLADGEIAGRAERAEHQQHLVLLDKVARQAQRGCGI
jgi:hypothetical protein